MSIWEALTDYFDSSLGIPQLHAEEEDARSNGLRGVPYYLINGHPMYGAQEVGFLLKALNAVAH